MHNINSHLKIISSPQILLDLSLSITIVLFLLAASLLIFLLNVIVAADNIDIQITQVNSNLANKNGRGGGGGGGGGRGRNPFNFGGANAHRGSFNFGEFGGVFGRGPAFGAGGARGGRSGCVTETRYCCRKAMFVFSSIPAILLRPHSFSPSIVPLVDYLTVVSMECVPQPLVVDDSRQCSTCDHD